MQIFDIYGVKIAGICACVPTRAEDNHLRCKEIFGDEKRALSVVKATGIKQRRVVDEGTSSLDLCLKAAKGVLGNTSPEDIGAVISVTFTPERMMPCNACQAQARLGLPTDIMAFDINLACSGWAYGLYVASMLVKSSGKKVLLLDGDAQTPYVNYNDEAVAPVLSDAGTATLLEVSDRNKPWNFAFMSNGDKGGALSLPCGGKISMDGFEVFKFVTVDVVGFISDFMKNTEQDANSFDAFVPHQANVFMIEQMAKKLGFGRDRLWISGDVLGNSASASVPVTIAFCGDKKGVETGNADRRILVSGFGGGLSASAASIDMANDCVLRTCEYGE